MIRLPTHPSLDPLPLDVSPAGEEVWRLLSRHLSLSRIHRVGSGAATPLGHYVIRNTEGYAYFAKVVLATEEPQQVAASRCAEVATRAGLRAPVLVCGTPLRLSPDLSLLLYQLLPGRHASVEIVDFRVLGRSIADLHLALAELDAELDIGDRTARRLAQLGLARSKVLKNHVQWFDSRPWAARLVQAWPEWTLAARYQPRPNHGDLNAGNLLVDTEEGFCFLDFEDALHSSLWPGFDLAKIIERLLLSSVDRLGSTAVARAARQLIEGYSALATFPDAAEDHFSQVLLWHLGMSLIILGGAGVLTSPEWQLEVLKLEKLNHLVERSTPLLRAIMTG